ncbi:ATP-binding protein, partial [Streptomyces spiralis]
MVAIPTQRETLSRGGDTAAQQRAQERTQAHATLPGSPLAPGSARGLARAALTEWRELGLTVPDRLADDVLVVVSELVTNAVVHAGTDVELVCRLEPETGACVVEVSDQHPSRAPRGHVGEAPYEPPEYGRGLRLVAALAEEWGVTYRTGAKTVWARLPAEGDEEDTEAYHAEPGLGVAEILAPDPQRAERDREWLGRGALSFLAEASDLLAGQLDEDLVAALTGQLIVPRLADWCAVWLEDEATARGGWND